MKQAVVVANGNLAGHQYGWGGAFGEGLRRHGWHVTLSNEAAPADMIVLWGVRRRQQIEEQLMMGGEVCILERGYVGDRFAWTSVSFGGGLNGRGEFRGVQYDRARFEEHHGHLMQPWRNGGLYALVMGQVPGDMALAPVRGTLSYWYRDTFEALRRMGYDVRFRPHPLAPPGEVPEGVKLCVATTLDEALSNARLVVTFNSNSGVDAVLAGVPTVATDAGSMARPVATHELHETPIRPDRAAWAARLAWCQWTMDEIRSGECWAHVGS